jgi:hypothetical protein
VKSPAIVKVDVLGDHVCSLVRVDPRALRCDFDEDERTPLNELAEVALREVTGLLEYLQSPEALRNARRARERRIATRHERSRRRPNSEPEP